jgi:hypothetical protein
MHAITNIKPITVATIKQFQQPDPMRAIESLMRQMINSGRARFATLILTDDDGYTTEIELVAPKQ